MTKAERLAAVFAIAFAIIYAPTMDFNWTLATYHPLQGVWEWFKAPPKGGGSPAMYWYGFVFTAGLFGLVVAGLAALVPDRIMARVPWATLTWVVTTLLACLHLLRPSALRDEDLSQSGPRRRLLMRMLFAASAFRSVDEA